MQMSNIEIDPRLTQCYLHISITDQTLNIIDLGKICKSYRVSTAKNGAGERRGSEQTPRGHHMIRAKIGAQCPLNTVFIARRPTGEIYQTGMREDFPNRDWILTRILWLRGMEVGKNRLGQVDTMQRYIYIHGTPDDVPMGVPGSRGCVRMRNADLIELFDQVIVGTPVNIE